MTMKSLILNTRNPKGICGSIILKKMNKEHQGLINWGLNSIDIKDNSSILDIGCGSGNVIKSILNINGSSKIYGIDYSELSVQKSIKNNIKGVNNGNVIIKNASVSHIPFDDNTFDIVTACETIYFWPNLHDDLMEVSRVVKNDGILLIICEMYKDKNSSNTEKNIVNMLNMQNNYKTPDELKNILINSNFKNVSCKIDETNRWVLFIAKK